MSLFRKIFGKKETSGENIKGEERGKYMPEIKIPIDEKFTINFKANGGKFLYCENIDEIKKTLKEILNENEWEDKNVFLLDERLKDLFKEFNLKATRKTAESTYFLSTCEYLIADDGSILISSNQIEEKNLSDFPSNLIILSETTKFKNSIGEGLAEIKSKSKKIPSNITTIKNFQISQEKDFLSYGTSAKNLYLILLEKGTI